MSIKYSYVYLRFSSRKSYLAETVIQNRLLQVGYYKQVLEGFMAGESQAGAKGPTSRAAQVSNENQGNKNLEQLSVEEVEALLAEKKREHSKQMVRQVRGQVTNGQAASASSSVSSRPTIVNRPADTRPIPKPIPPAVSRPTENIVSRHKAPTNFVPDAFDNPPATGSGFRLPNQPKMPVAPTAKAPIIPPTFTTPEPSKRVSTTPNPTNPVKVVSTVTPGLVGNARQATVAQFGDEVVTTRYRPGALSSQPLQRNNQEKRHWLDIAALVVEGLIILAVGAWVLYYLILSLNLFHPGSLPSNSANSSLSLLMSNGSVINIDAGQTQLNLATATATALPTATAVPTPTTATNLTQAVANQSVAVPTFTPLVAPTATPLPAMPKPVIVQSTPVKSSAAPAGYLLSPATRLVIPKIGLDTPVKEVTVKLGSWQVADFAAGHNLGTANPGEVGNVVIAGHRDIRGSVFLRLPDLQKGDAFTLYSDSGVFHYVVTETFIVAPTDIGVMNPTTEATATLITCTPLGTSNQRFIVRAKLVS